MSKSPDDPRLPDEGGEFTRPSSPADPEQTRPYTPPTPSTQSGGIPPVVPPGTGHVQRSGGRQARQRGRGQKPQRPRRPPTPRKDSGLYLPVWTLVLMLIIVMGLSFGIVFAVVSLGGNSAPDSEPVIRIITAIPSNTPGEAPVVLATPAPAQSGDQGIQMPMPTFALEGPTLEPVFLSPTPDTISVGKVVSVVGADPQELNIRDQPGVNNTNVLFRASDGTQFVVVDGPSQADGLTWWQVQNPVNPDETGWAVSNYLEVVPQ